MALKFVGNARKSSERDWRKKLVVLKLLFSTFKSLLSLYAHVGSVGAVIKVGRTNKF